jgi:hypothetical protein
LPHDATARFRREDFFSQQLPLLPSPPPGHTSSILQFVYAVSPVWLIGTTCRPSVLAACSFRNYCCSHSSPLSIDLLFYIYIYIPSLSVSPALFLGISSSFLSTYARASNGHATICFRLRPIAAADARCAPASKTAAVPRPVPTHSCKSIPPRLHGSARRRQL